MKASDKCFVISAWLFIFGFVGLLKGLFGWPLFVTCGVLAGIAALICAEDGN